MSKKTMTDMIEKIIGKVIIAGFSVEEGVNRFIMPFYQHFQRGLTAVQKFGD